MRKLLLIAPLALVLAACGGGSKAPQDPIRSAVEKTVEQKSYSTSTSARVTLAGRSISLKGDGGYAHPTEEGYATLAASAPGAGSTSVDAVFVKSAAWLKSPSYQGELPSGKEWIKVDLKKVGTLGFDFKLIAGLNPAYVLERLERTSATVNTVGKEEIDAVETTHYRAAIDVKKIPAADNLQKQMKALYKPVDVWVDGDGVLRQVRFDFTALLDPAAPDRARVVSTMKFSDFGVAVDVAPPAAKLVVDAAAPVGSG